MDADFMRIPKTVSMEPVDHAYIFYVYEAFFLFSAMCIKAPGFDFFYTFPGDMCGSFQIGRKSFFRYADNF